MNLIADTHTHTLFSGHAYSTITENMAFAAKTGLSFLCSTDHTGDMPDAPNVIYFDNQQSLPDVLHGVYLLRGCEANVTDELGTLDLPERSLARLEWVIASMHTPVWKPSGWEAHTEAWLQVAKNPYVDVVGHCGDERYICDYEAVVRAFAEHGKMVEINAHSFEARPGAAKNCRQIALLCKKFDVRVVVSSDAHFYTQIGNFGPAVELLTEIGYPEELVMNADYSRFAALAEEKSVGKKRRFPILHKSDMNSEGRK